MLYIMGDATTHASHVLVGLLGKTTWIVRDPDAGFSFQCAAGGAEGTRSKLHLSSLICTREFFSSCSPFRTRLCSITLCQQSICTKSSQSATPAAIARKLTFGANIIPRYICTILQRVAAVLRAQTEITDVTARDITLRLRRSAPHGYGGCEAVAGAPKCAGE